jgi:hypothetical protein
MRNNEIPLQNNAPQLNVKEKREGGGEQTNYN